MAPRVVMHLDMDAFYAGIEQRDRPELRGKPVIVGHSGRRGVVTTCSYEARSFGVRSAMPSLTAERLCPNGIWVAPRFRVYRDESRQIFALVAERVPVIEQVSIDEAYGDLAGVFASPGEARPLAGEIKQAIRSGHGLTASIGLAPNRFLAKIASDLDKPDGLTVIDPGDACRVLAPLSVRVIPGVGPKLGARLSDFGLETIGDLQRTDEGSLTRAFGRRTAVWLVRRARGEDERAIEPSPERKQVSEERTYRDDLSGRERIERELLERAEGVAETLRRRRMLGRTVTVKVRDGRFRTTTRALTLEEPTDLPGNIYRAACELVFERVSVPRDGLRLLGVGVKDLWRREEIPPSLFPDPRRARERRVAAAADELSERFGGRVLRPARLIDRRVGSRDDPD